MPADPSGKILSVAEESAVMRTATLTQSCFSDAARAWLETRRPYLAEITFKGYGEHIKTLEKFFGELSLLTIDADHVRAYQRMRMVRAGGSIINRECSVLQQMLKRIGRWKEIADNYQPLPLPKESPHRALTPLEEDRIYRIGASNPAWEVAYCCFVLSVNSTAHFSELRHIRLRDIDKDERTFYVSHGKNEGRRRQEPTNDTSWRALQHLLKRAESLGSTEPDHYLMPFRLFRGTYDPTRPATSCRSALNQILVSAEVDVSFYSFRHHAITKLLENPDVSDETTEAIAGHVSERMKKRYSHTRLHVKRAAIEALQRIAPKWPVEIVSKKSPKSARNPRPAREQSKT